MDKSISAGKDTGSPDILVIEDTASDRRLLQEAFSGADSDATLQSATNGDDAIDLLSRLKRKESTALPDLVLTDLNMPGRDGQAVVEAIRNELDLPSLPIVILSQSDNSDDVRRCYDAGANAFLTKPTDFEELVRIVQGAEAFWFKPTIQPSGKQSSETSTAFTSK